MKRRRPCRGDIWTVNLDPTKGHEQAGDRPAVVLSVDRFNHGPAGLVIVVPLTSTQRDLPIHIKIEPPEGGLTRTSFAMCEMVRSISMARLDAYWGRLSGQSLASVSECVRILLGL